MRVLIVGKWAKEEAFARSFEKEGNVYAYMGAKNKNIAAISKEFVIGDSYDVQAIKQYALSKSIDLALIGPTRTLEAGIVDILESEGVFCVGPSQSAFRLESDKAFVRGLMKEHGIGGV
ncbi:phosphoribosylamine--glycine ligase, partial [Gemmatimonadota bacterium]